MNLTIKPRVKVFLMVVSMFILCALSIWSAWELLITRERTATIVETTGTVLYSAAGGDSMDDCKTWHETS